MIEQKLNILESKYRKLSSTQQNDIESIISYLIDLVDESEPEKKSYLSEINKYLSNKIKREQKDKKPADIFQLRNILLRNRPFKSEYDDILQKLVWNILPELKYFTSIEKLSNFLGNYLHVDNKIDENIHKKIKNHKLKTKYGVVEEYKNIYDGFTKTKKQEALRELARGMFVIAHKDELSKYKELI